MMRILSNRESLRKRNIHLQVLNKVVRVIHKPIRGLHESGTILLRTCSTSIKMPSPKTFSSSGFLIFRSHMHSLTSHYHPRRSQYSSTTIYTHTYTTTLLISSAYPSPYCSRGIKT